MKAVLAIVVGLLLTRVLSAETSYIDMSKSYQVATLVGDSGNVYYRSYPPPRYKRYYKKRVYRKRYYRKTVPRKRHYKRRAAVPQYRYIPPRMTDEKRIQKALQGLGFYRGSIDGAINTYTTRAAIRQMNIDFGTGNGSSLTAKMRNDLIFLGTLFSLDEKLTASSNDMQTRTKRLQAALTVLGFYHDRIDGLKGQGTRRAISEYKRNQGALYGTSLNFDEEYELVSSAKKTNDTNIEETIKSLKSIPTP